MKHLTGQVFTHIRESIKASSFHENPGSMVEVPQKGFRSVTAIRKNEGYVVQSFKKLGNHVAELGYQNHMFNLLFRGQKNDYKDKKGQSIIYPSIYRPSSTRLSQKALIDRFNILERATKVLHKNRRSLGIHSILMNYKEYYTALLQHYELCYTPMLDLTHSLRVAASFALHRSKTGYLFVFGMPHPHGSISHYIDDSMTLVKLQNVCPSSALRPHFQEGYLVSRMPYTKSKEAGDNVARRLLAKYYIDNSKNRFWSDGFNKIPRKALLPENDEYANKLKTILEKKA